MATDSTTATPLQDVLDRLRSGCLATRLATREEALALGGVKGPEREVLLALAADRRDRIGGSTLTYSRKVFIPLTNLCRDRCAYCTFAQPPQSPSAHIMTPDEVLEVAEAGERLGCKEALFSLGEKPELRYPQAREELARLGYRDLTDYLRDMCRRVLEETSLVPHVNAGALARGEMDRLRPVTGSMGMMLESVSLRLMEKGGPHYECPDKHPKVRLRTLQDAGRLGVPFTTGILIGIGETWAERMDSLLAIQNVHERFGNIQEVIVQNFRSKPGTPMHDYLEPDLEDMLRTLAAARLLLADEISLQSPPNLALGDYGEYIRAGLNDWGGISPLTLDHINPEAAWPRISELRERCESRGFRLRERLTVYPRYLAAPERFIAPEVLQRLTKLVGDSGWAAEQHLA